MFQIPKECLKAKISHTVEFTHFCELVASKQWGLDCSFKFRHLLLFLD